MRFSKENIKEYIRLLNNPENLVGVAFFVKEDDKVLCIGDIGGTGVAVFDSNIWNAIEAFTRVAQMSDKEIASRFGSSIVTVECAEEDKRKKEEAIRSLKQMLASNACVADVVASPTSIMVLLNDGGEYDGPWDWDGFSVYAEFKYDEAEDE